MAAPPQPPTLNYQPPQAPPPGQYAPCPRCRCPYATAVTFTWWGGLLGPKLLTHVKCSHCGSAYNGKTGRDNTTGIVIYTLVGLVVGLGVLVLFVFVVAGL